MSELALPIFNTFILGSALAVALYHYRKFKRDEM